MTSPSKKRAGKWLILGALLILLVAALIAAPFLVDANKYRDRISDQLGQRLGRTVSLGSLSLSLFPSLSIRAVDAAVGDDPSYAQGPFISAGSVSFKVDLWSLLKGSPEVRSIELSHPAVVLIKGKRATWNWSTLKPLGSAEPSSDFAPMDIVIQGLRGFKWVLLR